MSSVRQSLVFKREIALWHIFKKDQPWTRNLSSGHLESRLAEESREYGGTGKYVLDALRNWRVYHFHDTGRTAAMKSTASVDDNRSLRSDAANLASFLYFLQERHPKAYRTVVRTVQLVAPFFQDFALAPSRLNPEKIRLEWSQRGSDSYLGPAQLSDDTLRFMALATLLLQLTLPDTVLIDEPELGLHPFAVTVVAGLMKSASTRSQLIISTQSPLLIDQFSPEDILVVDQHQGTSKFRRLEPDRLSIWLEEYSLGELWLKNLLGGRPSP